MDKKAMVELLAESWASIDGNVEAFKRGQKGDDNDGGHYLGYVCDAEELLARMNKRGIDIHVMSERQPEKMN